MTPSHFVQHWQDHIDEPHENFGSMKSSNRTYVLEQAYWMAVPTIAYSAAYHAQTLWLFTFSDLKTIAIPSTVAGISNAVAAPLYGIATAHHPLHVIWRAPLVFLWVWANLLPFDINNQRTPPAIAEDSINKPWRPMPQGRLSPVQAKAAMLCLYVVAQLVSLKVEGGLRQGIVLVLLGTWYNNLGGADFHPIIRNMINALGYLCFISGAMEVALGGPIPLSASGPQSRLLWWFGVLAWMILTTVHAQDISDQKGDALRGRRTIPLVIGDGPARWTIATSMMVWGLLCPAIWLGSALSWVLTVGLSILVGARTLARRNRPSDKRTYLEYLGFNDVYSPSPLIGVIAFPYIVCVKRINACNPLRTLYTVPHLLLQYIQ